VTRGSKTRRKWNSFRSSLYHKKKNSVTSETKRRFIYLCCRYSDPESFCYQTSTT